jgi:hypothetical protein
MRTRGTGRRRRSFGVGMNCTRVTVWRSYISSCRGRVEHQQQRVELEPMATDLAAWEEEAAAVDAEDDEALDWSNDGPDAEEQAAQQKAILESFESLKKVEDDARAREEDNEERCHRAVDLSIEADRRFTAEHRQRLREDRERWRAAYDGAGLSNAPPDGQ